MKVSSTAENASPSDNIPICLQSDTEVFSGGDSNRISDLRRHIALMRIIVAPSGNRSITPQGQSEGQNAFRRASYGDCIRQVRWRRRSANCYDCPGGWYAVKRQICGRTGD